MITEQEKQALQAEYNQRKARLEANFNENMANLNREFKIKMDTNAGDALNKLVEAKLKDKPGLDYSAAFSEVQFENPKLIQQYEMEIY